MILFIEFVYLTKISRYYMKIVIAGAGEVGFHLAKLLSLESLEITLIDINKDALNYAENHLDIRTVRSIKINISN